MDCKSVLKLGLISGTAVATLSALLVEGASLLFYIPLLSTNGSLNSKAGFWDIISIAVILAFTYVCNKWNLNLTAVAQDIGRHLKAWINWPLTANTLLFFLSFLVSFLTVKGFEPTLSRLSPEKAKVAVISALLLTVMGIAHIWKNRVGSSGGGQVPGTRTYPKF